MARQVDSTKSLPVRAALQVTTGDFRGFAREMRLQIEVESQLALRAGLMQLGCELLNIPAHIRIVALRKNQLLYEKFFSFGRIRRGIELEQATIGIGVDMRDAVSQSRLFRDVLLGYTTIVVFQ